MKDYTDLKTRPVGEIKEESVKETVKELNFLLADEYALFTKALNYHWNVKGPRFHSLHTFLEGQYNALLPVMDSIAERIRTLGETPEGTLEHLSEMNKLPEKNGNFLSANEMIYDLFSSNLKIQKQIKSILKKEELFEDDFGTEDFLVGLLQKHEKTSWMLKSHLE